MSRIQKLPKKRRAKTVKPLEPFRRKIHLPSGVWTYRITKSNVQIRDPDCVKTYQVCWTLITGMDWYNIERDSWKGSFKIRPSQIKKYIENHLGETS